MPCPLIFVIEVLGLYGARFMHIVNKTFVGSLAQGAC